MLQSVVHIPKSCRQPRTATSSRAHTYLPLPLSLPCNRGQGSINDISSTKEKSPESSTNSMDKGNDGPVSRHREAMAELSLFPCTTFWKGPEEGILLNTFEVPVTINESRNSCKNRNIRSYSDDYVRTSEVPLPSPPDNSTSPVSGNADAWLRPGSVVWAKTLYHEWWPAEVVDGKFDRKCSGSQHAGYVLVQLFGNNQQTWVDPIGDLSQFDHCYEERSINPLTAFQDALKQALCKHGHTSPRIQSDGSSGELKSSTPHEHSLDEWSTPSSSRTKDDFMEGGRGRRKRKLKIHFDELTFQEKPMRRLRRLRIMRNLGLAAPAGSPFPLSHGRSAKNTCEQYSRA